MPLLSGRPRAFGRGLAVSRPYASRMDWEDPDISEGLDDDGPSAEDLDRFGDEFIACPNCGKAIYDQSEICPYCGQAVMADQSGSKLWVMVVALIVAVAFILVLIR